MGGVCSTCNAKGDDDVTIQGVDEKQENPQNEVDVNENNNGDADRGMIRHMSEHFTHYHGVSFHDEILEEECDIEKEKETPAVVEVDNGPTPISSDNLSPSKSSERGSLSSPVERLNSSSPAGLPPRSDSRVQFPNGETFTPPANFNGAWKCTATWGMDEFLQKLGVGRIQRAFASKAPWPSWEFHQEGHKFTFVNHTAMGDMTEVFVADRSSYTMTDLKKNVQQCTAYWDNETLVIDRIGPQGACKETRAITGDSMEFILNAENLGCKWGRSFVRIKQGK